MTTLSLLPAVDLGGDELEPGDHYADLFDEFDPCPELTREEEAAADAAEAAHYASQPDPCAEAGERAVAVLREAGVEGHTDFDCGDDEGRGACLRLYVTCHDGCGAVATVYEHELGDCVNCKAPEGEASACDKGFVALAAAGAFDAGWLP